MDKLGAPSGEGAPVNYLIPAKLHPEIPHAQNCGKKAWIVLNGLGGRDSGTGGGGEGGSGLKKRV